MFDFLAGPGLSQLTSNSTPITITMPSGRGRGAAAGGGQIVALPAQGLLPSGGAITIQTKPGVSPAQKVLTIVTTTSSNTRPSAPLNVVTQVTPCLKHTCESRIASWENSRTGAAKDKL